jgi:hypothetical protein
VIPRAGAADGPATAVLATKPRKRRTVKVAATLTAPKYPDRPLRNPARRSAIKSAARGYCVTDRELASLYRQRPGDRARGAGLRGAR